MRADLDELILVSAHGFDAHGRYPFHRLSVGVDLPIADAFREKAFHVLDTDEVLAASADGMFADHWREVLGPIGRGRLLALPIECQGTPIGALSLICTFPEEFNPGHYELVHGVAAALGLWMSHPLSDVGRIATLAAPSPALTMRLDERQLVILRMVDEGQPTSGITTALGCSESTVKKSLHRAMTMLGARDRHEAVARARAAGLLP
jgi:DNA-binding CsgD family transcriptional regulator